MNKSIVVLIFMFLLGCKKFVQVSPPVSSIASATVYSNNNSAASVMTSVYDNMSGNAGALSDGSNSIGYLFGLSADEFTFYSGVDPFYDNDLTSQTGQAQLGFWSELYNEIYVCNSVLEAMPNSPKVTDAMKRQLTGEAKFMRAFLHFYATNLYGDIPLVTSTNYTVNNSVYRSSSSDVYLQIISDLRDAVSDLSDNYLDASGSTTIFRIRPNKDAAQALLARVFLYTKQYDSAAVYATAVINNTGTYGIENDFSKTFLANSKEAIWQLYPALSADQLGANTQDGYNYILTSAPGTGQYNVSISQWLNSAFEAGDLRYSNWVGQYVDNGVTYYFPYKYKVSTLPVGTKPQEYIMVLRLAEQYLIRAEARAQLNDVSGAQQDLNIIRTRAGLPNTNASDNASLLAAILHERQVEFFTEWGHRWFDLKRTNNLDAVLGSPGNICSQKGGTWSSFRSILPIPDQEILANHNLTQNPGY